jgi:peptidoglycan hydrolase CwlO-like protein
MTQIKKYLLVAGLMVFTLAASVGVVFAQTAQTTASTTTTSTQTGLSDAEKAQLQQQLAEIEQQIAEYQSELSQVQSEKNTLTNKINALKKQQSSLGLQIQATNLQIQQLNLQIADTEASIKANTEKIEELRVKLGGILSEVYQQDEYPLLYVLLSQNNLNDVITEAENYSRISEQLGSLMSDRAILNQQLEQDKAELDQKQEDTSNLLAIQNAQRAELTNTVNEQNTILTETKGKESAYQAQLNVTQAQAAQIRGRLYPVVGANTQITFGQAVEIAQWASGITGVRAAFLLAILTQESNLGKNVGTCNRAGDPPSKSWKVVMKPTRDQVPFQTITRELGLDIDTTPVSCPMHDAQGNQVGWGGAMGPAQFIPSTWMGYKDKVSTITGKPANPWDIRDAFLASGIKLKAGGAGTVAGEWTAAMLYFSGSTNPAFRFYGDNVVAQANKYQADIDALGN